MKVTFRAVDSLGNIKEIIRDFAVVDTTKPLLSLIGLDYIKVILGINPYTDEKATATDNYDADKLVDGVLNGDPTILGEYKLEYNHSDLNGNKADEIIRTIKVLAPGADEDGDGYTNEEEYNDDTDYDDEDEYPDYDKAPTITLDESNVYIMEVHGTIPTFIATATDVADGVVPVTITHDINKDVVANTYKVTFRAVDSLGNVKEIIRDFAVVDKTKPVITLIGDETINHEVNTTYTDQGATALDNYDGDITSKIVVTSTVDTTKVATYTVKYNVTDSEGNVAVEVTRTVNVVDKTKPVITLIGDETINHEVNTTYTDQGATALDNYDGDITSKIVVTSTVDTTKVATYTVKYNVTDSEGNVAVEVTRTVNVVDKTKPVITLIGDETINHEVNTTYTDQGATALDNYDGDITSKIVVTSTVDTTKVATYTVKYNVTDSEGNVAVEVTRTVNVVDTTAPSQTTHSPLSRDWSNTNIEITISSTDTDVTGYKYCYTTDGTLCTPSTGGNTLLLSNTGEYTVCSVAIDSASNVSDKFCSAVNAYKIDKVLPTFNQNILDIYNKTGTTFNLPTLTATDIDSGLKSITYKWFKDGLEVTGISNGTILNNSHIGIYYLTYTAEDNAGNTANQEIMVTIYGAKLPMSLDFMYEETLGTLVFDGKTFRENYAIGIKNMSIIDGTDYIFSEICEIYLDVIGNNNTLYAFVDINGNVLKNGVLSTGKHTLTVPTGTFSLDITFTGWGNITINDFIPRETCTTPTSSSTSTKSIEEEPEIDLMSSPMMMTTSMDPIINNEEPLLNEEEPFTEGDNLEQDPLLNSEEQVEIITEEEPLFEEEKDKKDKSLKEEDLIIESVGELDHLEVIVPKENPIEEIIEE